MLQGSSRPSRAERFSTVAAIVSGYLIVLALAPLSVALLPAQPEPTLARPLSHVAVMVVALALVLMVMRWHHRVLIRQWLSSVRAREVLRRLDVAALMLLVCSVTLSRLLVSRSSGPAMVLLALAAIIALCASLVFLRGARHYWLNSALLTRFATDEEVASFAGHGAAEPPAASTERPTAAETKSV